MFYGFVFVWFCISILLIVPHTIVLSIQTNPTHPKIALLMSVKKVF